MAVVFRPITRRTSDFSAFAWRLSSGGLKVSQEYDCRDGGSTDPDPIITRKAVPCYMTYHLDGIPSFPADAQRRQLEALKRKYLDRVVQRSEEAYQRDLNQKIGVFEMKIPFDAIIFPRYRSKHVELRSTARYLHFRATWQGMNAREWVLLSMPIGDEHEVHEIGECTPQGYRRYSMLGPSISTPLTPPVRPVPGRDYPPKTPTGRSLTAMQKQYRARILQERIEQLQEELDELNEEIEELGGQ